MYTSQNIRSLARRSAVVAAVALTIAACGGSDDAGGETGEVERRSADSLTPVDDVTSDDPASGQGSVGLAGTVLPVSATYGYIDVTVDSVADGAAVPEALLSDDPLTYVALNVTVATPLRDRTITVPPELLFLTVGGEEAQGMTADGADIEIDGEDITSATVWFGYAAGTSVETPVLTVQERDAEPLVISLTGEAPAPERVPVTMSGNYETECRLIEFGEGFASYNAGVTDKGDPGPGPDISPVGRAAEDELIVSFDITATERCSGGATYFYIRFNNSTAITESRVGSGLVSTSNSEFGQINNQTVDGQLAASVPEDSVEPLEIDFRPDSGEELPITLTADLSGVSVLVPSN